LVVGTNLVRTIPVVGESLYRALTGGTQPGLPTLIRFYAWHIFGLALAVMLLMIWHAFRVRRDGGIALPPAGQRTDPARISRSELVRREGLAMLVTGTGLIVLSLLAPAPIAPPITDLSAVSTEALAPWFFLWVQEMLAWGDPFVWGVLTPFVLLLMLTLIPFIFPKPAAHELGRWFPPSGRLAQWTAGLILLFVLLLTLLGSLPPS
jgi:quinol-cytochrome oxidoreductase complex cytochrome b subunit